MIANLSHSNNKTISGDYAQSSSTSPWEMLATLARSLNQAGIDWAVLGETDHLPAEIDSDVDLVIASDQFQTFETLIRNLAEAHGGRLVQAIQHEQTSWFYIIAWPGTDGQPEYLQLDVCSDYYRSGRKLLQGTFLLSESSRVTIAGADLRVPGPVPKFLYYLLKKSEKKSVTERQEGLLRKWWFEMTPGQHDESAAFFDGLDAANLTAILSESALAQNLSRFSSSFRRPRTGLSDAIREYSRLVRRVMNPNGLFVVMMGPDGSGKTTINTLAREYTSTAFWSEKYFHFRPFTASGDDESNIVTDPHGKPPRGTISSIGKLAYYLLDYIAGYILKIRPVMARSGLVIFDRYLPDMQVDTVRYRYGGPVWLLSLAGKMVPQPDLYVFLDVDAATILTRKQEVTPEECERQVNAYRMQADKLDNAAIIDAGREPHTVAAAAAWTMLNRLADKTERRLKR